MNEQIAFDRIGDVQVSTIRLAGYKYVVAETVVFDLPGLTPDAAPTQRYESLREAEEKHNLWVAKVRRGDYSRERV